MHEQFSGYLSAAAQDAAMAYLNDRVFPEMDRMAERTRHARNAYHILMGIAVFMVLMIPILFLLSGSLPDLAIKLSVCGLSFILTGILFVLVLMRLPQRAAEGRLKVGLLVKLIHAYFQRIEGFAAEDDKTRLQLLYTEAEKLL